MKDLVLKKRKGFTLLGIIIVFAIGLYLYFYFVFLGEYVRRQETVNSQEPVYSQETANSQETVNSQEAANSQETANSQEGVNGQSNSLIENIPQVVHGQVMKKVAGLLGVSFIFLPSQVQEHFSSSPRRVLSFVCILSIFVALSYAIKFFLKMTGISDIHFKNAWEKGRYEGYRDAGRGNSYLYNRCQNIGRCYNDLRDNPPGLFGRIFKILIFIALIIYLMLVLTPQA